MSFFTTSVSILSLLWVFILFLSPTSNAVVVYQIIVVATNTLDNGSLNLTISCPYFDPTKPPYIHLRPGYQYEWIYSGDITPTHRPLLCFFAWEGAAHTFNMYDPTRDSDCEECNWHIGEKGPCRFRFPNREFACYNWF